VIDGESKRGGVPPVVFALLRGAEDVPMGLSLTVGGAYATGGYSLSWRYAGCCVTIGLGAGGACRAGMILSEAGAAPGGRGAGRFGTNAAPTGGELGTGDVRLRGMGGGARGFSKLSSPFRGKRGLCGGLRGWVLL
jgi:hypothetical protein